MSKLSRIRGELASLRLWRQLFRWSGALALLLAVVIVAVLAMYLLDYSFERLGFHTTAVQRLILVLLGLGGVAWVFVRYCWPLLSVSETDLEMALWVERQQGIDTDLVAALQFEQAERAGWGSPQLQAAVVDYVGDWSERIDVYEGLDRRGTLHSGGFFLGAVAVLLLIVLISPSTFGVFLRRVALLQPDHYPSATELREIVVLGKSVGPTLHALKPVRSAMGQPLTLRVQAAGTLPTEGGFVDFTSQTTGESVRAQLLPDGEPVDGVVSYRLQGDRKLRDSLTYQVYLNDAWTNPAGIEMAPLPIVKPELLVDPPAYAAGLLDEDDPPTDLKRGVLEGSRLKFALVDSTKPLRSAVVAIQNGEEWKPIPLKKEQRDGGTIWTLDTAGTPFARVTENFRFRVYATDTDDLALEKPLEGAIRLREDRSPTLAAASVHRVVMPDAEPVIELRARDDFAVSAFRLRVQIERANRDPEIMLPTSEEAANPNEIDDPSDLQVEVDPRNDQTFDIAPVWEVAAGPNGQSTTRPAPLPHPTRGGPLYCRYRLDLSKYDLEKGDQVRLTVEADDYRGPGADVGVGLSEPLVLEVSDAAGVLAAAIDPATEQSVKTLGNITNLQSGVGDSQ